MTNYHLSPAGPRWTLTREGGKDLIGNFETKEEALASSTSYLAEREGSLKIHRGDGTMEEERTYPRAADPRKSPG